MLDFEGNETPGNRILNFLHFSYKFLLIQVSTTEILCIELHCILTNRRNVRYTELHKWYKRQVKMDCVTDTTHFTVGATIRLAVCVSRSCR
jgi:hypothetical protein